MSESLDSLIEVSSPSLESESLPSLEELEPDPELPLFGPPAGLSTWPSDARGEASRCPVAGARGGGLSCARPLLRTQCARRGGGQPRLPRARAQVSCAALEGCTGTDRVTEEPLARPSRYGHTGSVAETRETGPSVRLGITRFWAAARTTLRH